jgi:type IV pilus assembly protein PilF
MRLRNAVVICLLAALAGAGCSRVAFIKTDPSRKGYDRVAEPVVVQDTAASRQRAAGRNALDMSQQRLTEGDLAAAEQYARAALKADPQSADAYTLLAVIADEQGHGAAAGANFQRAAELAPQDGGVLNNYGTWLCTNGRAAESLAWFDRALLDPSYPTPAAAQANAGRCALDAGQVDRARRDLRMAIERDPQNPVALEALARLEMRSGRYMEARAFSERRLAAAPATAEALLLASQIEDKLGDSAAAARYGRRLREEFPGVAQGNAGGSKAP